MLFAMTMALAAATAVGAEAPTPEPTVAITVDAKTDRFVPLKSGSTLSFETPGPQRLLVTSRRRMAGAGQRANPAPIQARGDGHPIITIQVPGSAIASGRIHDRLEGFPSKQDASVINVPEGGKLLSLTAPAGGPDFFIRLTRRETPNVLLLPIGAAVPTAASAAKADQPPPKEAPRSGTSPSEEDEAAAAGEAEQRSGQAKTPQPEREGSLTPGAGIQLGFGLAARGTAMVFHMGVTGRYPIYKDLLSVGGGIGWHRIGVEEEVSVIHPSSGSLKYHADWHTTIVPIVAEVTVHVPYSAGPVTPIASAGLGLFIASRTEDSTSVTKIAVGPSLAIGCEIDINVGALQTTVSWSEARARLGNRGVDGDPVAETFAVTRLNFSYLYTF